MTLLIVASETSSPFCTPEAIPTDGQPQWWRGPGGKRFRPTDPSSLDQTIWSPVGPFPFTAARWAEVKRCRNCGWCIRPGDFVVGACEGSLERVGAIVELVEVVGPSHHADECDESYDHAYTGERFAQFCYPDAAPDCWHTPTGTVTPIDPIPCERPVACQECREIITQQLPDGERVCPCPGRHRTGFTSAWTAPEDITAKLTEVTA